MQQYFQYDPNHKLHFDYTVIEAKGVDEAAEKEQTAYSTERVIQKWFPLGDGASPFGTRISRLLTSIDIWGF